MSDDRPRQAPAVVPFPVPTRPVGLPDLPLPGTPDDLTRALAAAREQYERQQREEQLVEQLQLERQRRIEGQGERLRRLVRNAYVDQLPKIAVGLICGVVVGALWAHARQP